MCDKFTFLKTIMKHKYCIENRVEYRKRLKEYVNTTIDHSVNPPYL